MMDNAAMSNQYPNQTPSTIRAGQSMSTVRQRIGRSVALALLTLLSVSLTGQNGTVMPYAKIQFFDNNGDPCNGCLLSTFAAGTSTPLATYSESTLTTPNANPVVMDSAGRATVFLSPTAYKFVLKSAASVTIWTVDGISAVGMPNIGAQIVSFGGLSDVPVTATAYPSGTTFATLHAGTLMWSINSANIGGTYALEGMLLGSGGTITAALVNLSDGAPDTPIVTIASSNAVGERQISGSITFPAAGTAKTLAVKVKVSAGYGYAWSVRLVRVS